MASRKDLKSIVDQIKKRADAFTGSFAPDPTSNQQQPPPPANQGGSGTITIPTVEIVSDRPRGGGRVGPNPIKEMQQKMVDLSTQVRSQLNLGATSTADPRVAQEAEGRRTFNDFIARMLRGQGGYEYTPDEAATQRGQKGPMAPTRMQEVMNTVNRIGSPQSEKKPDGIWDFRTNNALHDIRAFAQAMLTMAAAFGLPIKSYSQGNVDEFVLPRKETDISQEDKMKSAPIISQHLDAISDMFTEIKDGILENPQYETYIEDDTPYATIAPPKAAPGQPQGQQPAMLTSEEANDIAKVFPSWNIAFTGPDGQVQQKPINITNLVTLQALQKWMNDSGVKLTVPQITSQIRREVTLMPRRYTPEQDEAWNQQQWKREQEAAKAIRKQKPGGPGVSGNVNVRTSSKR